ncbi:SMP-30/gluconolactonase/LRE family protein [Candidatus Latescibacterota bacterium]
MNSIKEKLSGVFAIDAIPSEDDKLFPDDLRNNFMVNKTLLFVLIIITVITGCTGERQPAVEQQSGEDTSIPFVDSPVVEDGAIIQQISTGHAFTEGPVVDDSGNLYFVDIPFNTINKIDPDGVRSSFVRGSGCANGLAIDSNGVLHACLNVDRCVVSIDSEGNYTVLADNYQGKKFNNPNDLWIDAKGGIYFTDPAYYLRLTKELDGEYVYYITPDRLSVMRVIDDTVQPNGIIGTPDNKLLYVADPGQRTIFRYTINEDGTLSNKTEYVKSGSDGMTIDSEGNIYLTGRGISVYNPNGTRIETISVPEGPSNLCFGGSDKKTLFITARTSVYSLRMKVSGL